MHLFINVHLFNSPFTTCSVTESCFTLPNKETYRLIGTEVGGINSDFEIDDTEKSLKNKLKLKTSAFFLQPFVKECLISDVFRTKMLTNLKCVSGCLGVGVVCLKLILEPPDKEILDYSWNDKMLRLIWTRVEIENAFSWLSTLGGAYSALGDYFKHCAEEAGRISIRQYKLSQMLGDEGLAARSKLYSALAHAQKGNLKLARQIVRNVAAFAQQTQDRRLNRMCQGVWAKLKYLRRMEHDCKTLNNGSGDSIVK